LDPEAVRLANITLGAVEATDLDQVIEVTGRITVNEESTARVGSFTEGVVVECCEPVGGRVEKNQVLARLHSHEIHEAESAYWQARADLERRKAELDYAAEAHKRASRLHELKAGSLQQVQQAETQLRAAESFLHMAEASLARAESHLQYLGLSPAQLSPSASEHAEAGANSHEEIHLIEVRSPMAGTIIERSLSRGAVVTPSDALYVVSDLSRLWVIAQVPEQYLSLLRVGMAVEVTVPAYPESPFAARVEMIGDRLDPETRTVQVRCGLPNPDRKLKTEMFATLRIHSGRGDKAIVVPLGALQTADGEDIVFVPAGENSYRAQRVTTGRRTGSTVEITAGLQPGDEVVVSGAFQLKSELLKGQLIEDE
jgi:multidrug efflux pump subunit AcrA (membrane-fusion protein)